MTKSVDDHRPLLIGYCEKIHKNSPTGLTQRDNVKMLAPGTGPLVSSHSGHNTLSNHYNLLGVNLKL